MDKEGDIKYCRLPSGQSYKKQYAKCITCGELRWVVFVNGKIDKDRCRKCSQKLAWQKPEVMEIRSKGIKRSWDLDPERKKETSLRQSGVNCNFYGKDYTEISLRPRLDINIYPSKEWGYFIGMLLGDGCLHLTKKSYAICVSSTIPEITEAFYECCQRLNIHCSKYYLAKRKYFHSDVVSKSLYIQLRPYKTTDFHFTIPEIVYTNLQMVVGFLQGFFDAEGGAYLNDRGVVANIQCWSKHVTNLVQVQTLLDMLGIKSQLHKEKKKNITSSRLNISNYADKVLFRELVGFRIKRKQDRLVNDLKEPETKTHSLETYNQVMELLSKGYVYTEIKKITKVSTNTIAGWHLYDKKPRAVRVENMYKNNREEMVSIYNQSI